MPPGTIRYWSWLFAAAEARAPLLGIFALQAEWHALMDPATERSVAYLKLAWWQQEMQRLRTGSSVHPISGYLAGLPRAAAVDFAPLVAAVEAAAVQAGGAPLERTADLSPHSQALWGNPLIVASRLSADAPEETGLLDSIAALAAAEYLSRAIQDYRREARFGRVPFAVDELLSAGIENADLAADRPPPHLQRYLDAQRARSARSFETAARALPPALRPPHRHLLVLAALGAKHLNRRAPPKDQRRIQDMLLAWASARRAQR